MFDIKARLAGTCLALAITGAIALAVPNQSRASPSFTCRTFSVDAPYFHVDSVRRRWLYAQSYVTCYNFESATMHSAIEQLLGGRWYSFGTPVAATMEPGGDESLEPQAYFCWVKHTAVTVRQYVWINYTDDYGRHGSVYGYSHDVYASAC